MCDSWERLCYHLHQSLMEKNYVFAPWGTHGVELLIANKMPKCMHNMWSYIGKKLRHLPQKNISVNCKIIGCESHLHSLRLEDHPVLT